MNSHFSIDTRARDDGLYDCFEVERDAKGANPFNPILSEELVAEGVSHEYAVTLENEFAREVFRAHGEHAVKMFGHVGFWSRRIGMFAVDNTEHAENPATGLVY